MPTRRPTTRSPISSAVILAGLIVLAPGPDARGQGTGRPRPAGENPGPTRTFVSAEACASCHGGGDPSPISGFGQKVAPRLVRLDEFTTWLGRDKHRRAFDALTGPRGREIGLVLKIADVSSERACLSCHAKGFLPDDPPAEASGALEARAQGVSCTACHGAYLEWVQAHGLAGEPIRRWRRLSTVDKTRDFGMTNLRDPATRAKVCLSCHLGDASEGKVVSHPMYAAGHPPLPGIELESFLRAMPPHWWEPDEVPLFRQDPGSRARYQVDASESPRSRAVLIGGVVALRESMRLLAARAEGDLPGGGGASTWPDYARFECYSCHHDLKAPGYRRWRQVRGFGHLFDGTAMKGKAGHASIRPWPLALVESALLPSEGSADARMVRDSLLEGVKGLHTALDDRPFGDPHEVAPAARRLEAASQRLLDGLEAARFDGPAARKLLGALADVPDRAYPDYDSARQRAWAIRSILGEARPGLGAEERVAGVLVELDRLLKFDPHASREPRARRAADTDQDPGRISQDLIRLSEEEYRRSLSIAAEYDPVEFKKVMTRLSTLLGETALDPLPR